MTPGQAEPCAIMLSRLSSEHHQPARCVPAAIDFSQALLASKADPACRQSFGEIWWLKVIRLAARHLQVLGSTAHLGGEAFHMILLRVQRLLGDEDGEVGVLDAHCFDLAVEPGLDVLPDAVCPGPQDVAACAS